MANVHSKAIKHGTGVFAHQQTAGKGQRGKVWQTGKDQNIALSIAVEPRQLSISQQFPLSIATALACRDFFSAIAGEAKIKWPNDIYWREKKAAGILIENVFRGKDWMWAIIGIGININQTVFDAELKNPVSLKQITGKDYDVVELAGQLHQMVMKKIDALQEMPIENLMKEYHQHLYKLNETVKLKKANKTFNATIKGVDQNGQLVYFAGIEEKAGVGEVEWNIT